MKYHEINNVEFVKCYDIDPLRKSKHDKAEETDEGCLECMELYYDLQNDLIDDFKYENPKREVDFILEQTNYENNNRLCFALWSVPIPK